jgi:hypothetical protein
MLQCLSLLLLSRHASAEVGDSAEQVASSLSGSIAIIIEKNTSYVYFSQAAQHALLNNSLLIQMLT